MRYRFVAFVFLVVIVSFSCKKTGCLESAGDRQVLQRNSSSFHQIYLYDDIDLMLTQDTVEWIKVEAGQNLQPNILTEINNGILTIKNTTNCKWLRNAGEKKAVHLGLKNLDYIFYAGSGNISSTNTIVADKISFYTRDGAGNVDIALEARETTASIEYENADFIFRGKSDACNVYVNSRGSIDFKNFEVKRMNIGYASVRDATINVSEVLETLIYHTGNLYYKGNPSYISTHSYSTGKLLRAP